MTHILLVEDNEDIGSAIVEYLEYNWHTIQWSKSWDDGVVMMSHNHFDCIILDIMLPGMDGISVLKFIREKYNIPVIMTTAKWQIEDKELWFTVWADDYLVKPFALKELLLRIKALVKRSEKVDIFRRNDIEIFIDENEVRKSGKKIPLTLKERQILLLLLEHEKHTISRTEIVQEIWWGDAIWENDSKLDVYISNLRKKLSKDIIQTIKW